MPDNSNIVWDDNQPSTQSPTPAPSSGIVWDAPNFSPAKVVRDVNGAATDVQPQAPETPSRGFAEHNADAYGEAANTGFGGWLAKEGMYYTNHLRPAGLTDAQWYQALNNAQKAQADMYAAKDQADPSTGGSSVASLLGSVVGSVNPLYLFGGVGGAGLKGVASRIGTVAAANAAGNALGQGLDIHDNLQKEFDPYQSLATGAGAGLLHGVLGEALPAAMPTIKKFLRDESSGAKVPEEGLPTTTPTTTPKMNLSDEDKSGIQDMVRAGHSTDEILQAYPHISDAPMATNQLDWYVKHGPKGSNDYHGPINWAQGIPEGGSIKVDKTPTDVAGTEAHDVTILDKDGNVHATGILDPNVGNGMVVMSHPDTHAPHTMSRADADKVREVFRKGQEEASPAPEDTPATTTTPTNDNTPPEPPEAHPETGGLTIRENPPTDSSGAILPSHSFTYTTSDGKVVHGQYDLEDGQIHSVDIGDKTNPVDLGAGETLNLARQLAMAHPEVTGPDGTIEGVRTTGANGGGKRSMVLNADRLRARAGPDTPDPIVEAPKPVVEAPKLQPSLGDADKYAGNINKPRLFDENGEPVSENVRSDLDDTVENLPNRESLGNDQTRKNAWSLIDQHGEDALLEPTAFRNFSHPDDLVAWPVAVRNILDKRAIEYSRLHQSMGDTSGATQEQLGALSDAQNSLRDTADRAMDVIAVGPRMTQSGHIEATPSELTDEEWAEVKENGKEAIVKSGGDPDVIDKVMKGSATKKGRSLLSQAWYASLLSNWQTHFHYAEGLGLQSLLDLAQNAVGSALGQLGRFGKDADNRIFGREVAARAFGSISGAANAIGDAASSLKSYGKDILSGNVSLGRMAINIPLSGIRTIGDIANQAGRQGQLYSSAMRKAIQDSDQTSNQSAGTLLKGLVGGEDSSGNSTANDVLARYKDYLENPTEDMLESAKSHGEMLSFEDKSSPFTTGMKSIQFALDKAAADPTNPVWTRGPAKALSVTSRVLLPFIGREDAVIRSGIRNGMLGLIPGMDRYNTALMAKAAAGDGASRDLMAGKAALAMGVSALLATKALDGTIIGSTPTDPSERAQFIAEGKIPESYLGSDGQYHSLRGITPLANNVTMLADAVGKYKKDEDLHDYWKTSSDIAGSLLHGLADPTWLGSLAPLLDNSNHGNRIQATGSNLVGSVIPQAVRVANQTYFDHVQRDVSSDNFGERSLNTLKSSIPGLSQSLPAKLDMLGRPITLQKGLTQTSTPDQERSGQEIERLSPNGKSLVNPPSKVYIDEDTGEKTKFTPDQYRKYESLSGQYIRQDMANTMKTPPYQQMSDEDKRAELKSIVSSQRANAKDEVLNGNQIKWDDEKKIVWDK